MNLNILMALFLLTTSVTPKTELTNQNQLGGGVIVLILFTCLSVFFIIMGRFTPNPLLTSIIAILIPLIIFTIIHFWPKQQTQTLKDDDRKDYWVIVRWIFFSILLLSALLAIGIQIKRTCFKSQFAVKLNSGIYTEKRVSK